MSEVKIRGWEWPALALLLSMFIAQAALSSRVKSAAFDEQYHLAAGYAYLRTGDFRMSLSHPPLIDSLSALPLLFRPDINLPLAHPAWANSDYFIFSDVFLWQANDNPQQLLLLARLPIIALGALLAAALFFWGRRFAGPPVGWGALILAVFDPNLLANSRLVTTDLGLAVFMLLVMWRLWHWLERPTRLNLILVGLMAGFATASKFTGLMVWPIILGVMLLWPKSSAPHLTLRSLLAHFLLMGVVGYAALWAVFGFDVGPIPNSGFPLPIPAPFYPYSALDTFRVIEEQPKTSFLLGQTSPRGWWYYFPMALAVKTPLPLLLLATAGALILVRRQGWGRSAVLWLPPLLFMSLAMTGRITIGYRHILPIVPFLIMLGAQVGRLAWGSREPGPLVRRLSAPFLLILLLAWQVVGTLRLFPHHEAFFNALAGGPAGGDRVLVDSNIDWGQDLIALKGLLEEKGIDEVYLSYFGTALPEAYGLSYKPIPGFLRFVTGLEVNAYNPYTPPPGWYAISVTSLRLGLLEQNLDMYAYFRGKEPVARAGYSIHLYEVRYAANTPVDRTVVSGRPVSDIAPESLGVRPGRRLLVKWAQSPETIISPPQPLVLPPDYQPVSADFAHAFSLTGYRLSRPEWRPGEVLELELYWQRGTAGVAAPAPAAAPPLAAFVHLSGQEPADIIAQFDGWEVALTGLEAGDIIAQRVTIPIPEDAAAATYYLRVGLYSPQTLERLPLAGGEMADMVTLTAISIR